MAWFGESFASIKGQISNFTKEVLTEGSEENEEFADSDELLKTKILIKNLETTCAEQKIEVEQLRRKVDEKSEVQERQLKCVAESYDKLLHCKEEENKRLREQVSTLILKQQQYKEEFELINKNDYALVKNSTSDGAVTGSMVQPIMQDASTEAGSTKEDEDEYLSFRLELEERCTSYQNDLFLLREELINLQQNVDEKEIQSAKRSEEICLILNSEFVLDGQPAVKSKPKQSQYVFGSLSSKDSIISSLNYIASIWKDLVDRKATLERTITKLSLSESNRLTSETSNKNVIHGNEMKCGDVETTMASNFMPPKVDLYGLETIIEDETGEEDNHLYDSAYSLEDQPSSIAVIHKLKSGPRPAESLRLRTSVSVTSSSSQTVEPDEPHTSSTSFEERSQEDSISEKAEELDLKRVEKENSLVLQVNERNSRIRKLEDELKRLKTHLVDFEEQATSDALVNEEREKHLRMQVAQLKTQIAQTLEDNDKVGDVREEIYRLTTERDVARAQGASFEDQVQKLNIQLQNLHFVLEQFQKEKETDVANIEKDLRKEINQLKLEKTALVQDISVKEEFLEKARSGLDAAQQLSCQIDEKCRQISVLKTQVQDKETEIGKLATQVKEVGCNLDGKVDRYLLKNLIVGYFSTPPDKRIEVLRVIATVLDFNREDRQKTGLEAASIWPFNRAESSSVESKPSLSEAFIRFLENESQPKVEVRIPSEEIARRSSRSSSSTGSQRESSIPRSNSPADVTNVVGSVAEISLSLPVLSQIDRSNSILKDVLNPKPY